MEELQPYTESDPDYRNTPLISPIPRPTIQSCPPQFPYRTAQEDGTRHHQNNNYPAPRRHNNSQSDYQRHRNSYGSSHHRNEIQASRAQHHSLPQRINFTPNIPTLQRQIPNEHHSTQRQQPDLINAHTSDNYPEPSNIVKAEREDSNFFYCKIPFDETRELEGLKMVIGPPIQPDYNQFCIGTVVEELVKKKEILEEISHEQLTAARGKSNLYEKTGNSIFMNRAAIKLASLDAENRLTGLKSQSVSNRPYLFADLCGGPGGFSEYLLWRKKTSGDNVFGWGITLKGDEDFKMKKFHPDTGVDDSCFNRLYGVDGTGDIYKEENIREFGRIILDKTQGVGVDLVTADGGINVRGRENQQENLMRQLILCQVITMFLALKQNGDFVLKLFDIFSPFTAGIVWILYRHFQCIRIFKPLASRPANSERYIICRGLCQSRPTIINFLFDVNRKLNDLKSRNNEGIPTQDITQIVDFEELSKDQDFMQYLRSSNMMVAIKQREAVEKILAFAQKPELRLQSQDEARRKCFHEWRLPLEEREDGRD